MKKPTDPRTLALQAFFEARPGLSKASVAKQIQVDVAFFHKWLTGEKPVPERHWEAIDEALEVYEGWKPVVGRISPGELVADFVQRIYAQFPDARIARHTHEITGYETIWVYPQELFDSREFAVLALALHDEYFSGGFDHGIIITSEHALSPPPTEPAAQPETENP